MKIKKQSVVDIGMLVLTLASGCSKPLESGIIIEKIYESQKEYSKEVFFFA